MQEKDNLRQSIAVYIIIFYLLPVLGLTVYSMDVLSRQRNWDILGVGLLLAMVGVIFFIVKMWQWEGAIFEQLDLLADSKAALKMEKQPQTTTSAKSEALPFNPSGEAKQEVESYQKLIEDLQKALEDSQRQHREMIEHVGTKGDEVEVLIKEKEALQQHLDQMHQELNIYQQTSREQLKQKELMLAESAQTVADLHQAMDKKQQQIVKLESSVRDLTYEVKTLLQLSESSQPSIPRPQPVAEKDIPKPLYSRETKTAPSIPPPPYSPETARQAAESKELRRNLSNQEAYMQMKRCVDIAQKMTGASHFGSSTMMRDFSVDSYALEQRRLFDSLQSENTGLVLVYSQREDKVLFANQQTKTLLGWGADKFVQDFPSLIQSSSQEWRKALNSLGNHPETQVKLLVKTKAGQDQPLNCQLGLIPTGIFKNHVVGVLSL